MKKQKIAIITGASSGIGKAIYEYLESKDWKVLGLSRRGPDHIIDLSKQGFYHAGTLEIDLLVNAAGIMPFDETRKVMDVNFWGTVQLTEKLIKEGNLISGSCVINIGSVSAEFPDEHLPIYSASKAALISWTKSMAKRYVNLRFNVINPGFYKTNLVPGELPKDLLNTIPMGYEEDPAELAPLVESIYNCKYMTGSVIKVDGGATL